LPIYAVSFTLNDFIEQYEEESQKLTDIDYEEIAKIKQNPFLLTKSYLFKKIEPFLLPFYEKKRGEFLNSR